MRNLPHKVTGDDLTADEFNDIPEEEENLITSAGIALSAGDLYQIAKSVATYVAVGDFYTCTNAGNDYTLTPISSFQTPAQYLDGFRIRFRVSATNTGTARFNVNTLGWKYGAKEDGISDLGPGDLPAGQHAELIYNSGTSKFELYSHKYEDQVFNTGDELWTDATGARAGWIWINDSTKTTIGDLASNANIRNDADCEALFTRYWAFNATDCPIYTSAGVLSIRGANAAADWAAHKRMAIPDKFRKAFAVHDVSDPNAMRIGQIEGERAHTLSPDELAKHVHPVVSYNLLETAGQSFSERWTGTFTRATSENASLVTAHNNMPPTVYTNLYIKL